VSSTEDTQTFTASRWTKGNRVFPTKISVSPVQVIKTKRSWFSSDEESININSHGDTKRDAQRIKQTVEDHQRTFREGAFSDSAGTRKCPHCAETIKSDAKVCRFCNREL